VIVKNLEKFRSKARKEKKEKKKDHLDLLFLEEKQSFRYPWKDLLLQRILVCLEFLLLWLDLEEVFHLVEVLQCLKLLLLLVLHLHLV
jgi:hypothetical protein